MSASNSIFVRACQGLPTDSTPVWFLRQAGRYMAEYREVRKHHTLVEICKRPELAAEGTITAAEEVEVAPAIEKVAGHFGDAKGMIGFCGSPFTLASYMIEGGSSRNYIFTKQMMYSEPYAWQKLMDKLVTVLLAFAKQQVDAGADVIQIFDSWVGSLSVEDYRDYVFPVTKRLVRAGQGVGVPGSYFVV